MTIATIATQSIADIQLQGDVMRYVTTAGVTILFYDYTLTFSTEVDRYWGKGFSWASFFFFVNRYISVGQLMCLIEDFWRSSEAECNILQEYHQVMAIVIQFIVGILQVMRTYAIYNRSRTILGALLVYGFCLVGLASWAVLGNRNSTSDDIPTPSAVVGCVNLLTKHQSTDLAITWSCLLAFDSTIFGLMLFKYVQSGRFLARGTLMRDGTLYFGIMGLTHVFTVISYLVFPSALRGVGSAPSNFLSTTLMSRLMLNIRDPRIYWPHSTTTGAVTRSISMGQAGTSAPAESATESDQDTITRHVASAGRYRGLDVEMQSFAFVPTQ